MNHFAAKNPEDTAYKMLKAGMLIGYAIVLDDIHTRVKSGSPPGCMGDPFVWLLK